MTRALNPACHYVVKNVRANLTRGTFNTLTGSWLAYEHQVKPEDVNIKIDQCLCGAGTFWVTEAELDKAEGVIACEYCGRYLLPFMYEWGTR